MLEEIKNMKVKDLLYVLAFFGLGGSEVWQYLDFESKIHRDTEKKTKTEFVENVDSLRQMIANEEFAKGVFNEGVMAYKDFDSQQAQNYMKEVLRVADEAIENDSFYTHVEKPMLVWLSQNKSFLEHLFKYQYLAPVRNREDNLMYFNWIDGVYPVNERNGVVSWTDRSGDSKPLQSISNIADR